jgi:DNA-binding NtrC family response regulator
MNETPYPLFPIMIVDDEMESLTSLRLGLQSGGLKNILTCQDSREVMPILSKQGIEAILLDLVMPFISGEELLTEIVWNFPEIPVIIVTGSDDIDTAVKCMKSRAFDYLVKPVEKSRLISSVKRAVELRELRNQNEILKQHILTGSLREPDAFSEIITRDKNMLGLFQYVESMANSREPVLITGETGVGKELMAKAVHTVSKRSGPFVSCNVAGIDDNAFSDTLFGHTRGAFTGADHTREGLVEKASGGSLFMDEIGDLSSASQVKLLRLVQEREYFPLGQDLPKITDARIIATTNQDPEDLKKSGRFRKDLYYRLSTHHFHIPPLRKRLVDLPLLLDHFMEEASEALGKAAPNYPEELVVLLSNYPFPGNIRELRTLVYDAVSRHKSGILSMKRFQVQLEKEHLYSSGESAPGLLAEDFVLPVGSELPTLRKAIRILVAEAMKRSKNNQSMAARLLGISRQTLARHLEHGSE